MDTVTGVGVLDKAVGVVRSIVDQPRSLSELQQATGLPRATAHRLAVALEAHGLLRRNDDGRFDLGHELVVLGRSAIARFPLVDRSLPILNELRDATGESVQLFVRQGTQRRCLISLPSPHALRWNVPEGSLFPLELGSAGRVLDGQAGPRKWLHSVEEREAGVASVSAAVFDQLGSVIAAVSVSGPIDRVGRQPGRRFGPEVVAAAAAITDG